jgi:formylglycine-generating enzyme required for sulfatase activity
MTKPQSMPATPPPQVGRLIRARAFRPPPRGAALPRVQIAWLPLLTSLVLALWALAAWYVFTARAVTLASEPADASLEVVAWLAPRISNHWLLRPGEHRVRASAPGYHAYDAMVSVDDAPIQTRRIVLERLPGHLNVRLEPAIEAEVFVDEQPFGTAPGVVRDIPAGTRQVEIRAPRYRAHVVRMEIEGKAIEQSLAARLEPAWAVASIDSQPSHAELSVDGKVLGATPYQGELLEGRRAIKITQRGYKPWQQTLKVVAGMPVKLGTVVLTEADGQLQLKSTPAGASVTLDDNFVGRTPLAIALTPGRSHRLHVLAEGYVAAERNLTLAAAASETLDLKLEPELANVQFITTPDSAELLVDGIARGSANQTLALPTRDHEVTLRALGHATYSMHVTPRKGVEKRFRVRLKTIAEAAAEQPSFDQAPPATHTASAGGDATRSGNGDARDDNAAATPSVTTSAGQLLKLFGNGQVVLGSSRADAARRADETERPVVLKRAFYLGAKEVSNGEFRAFLGNHHASNPAQGTLDDDSQPVVDVDWQTAALYCNWLSRRDGLPPFYQIKYGEVLGVNPAATGYRLPTEAEWEWAARTTPEGASLRYAWGDVYPPARAHGNYADDAAEGVAKTVLRGLRDGFALSAPVGSFPPNPRGLYDLDGNVAEWVHDHYDANPAAAPSTDPLGPPSGTLHVIKGASWALSSATDLRLAARASGERGRNDVGFRLARYAQ